MGKKIVIAVDGPAGTGKSTVCKLFAKRAGYTYLDTGALYRAVAYRMIQLNLTGEDEARLSLLLKKTKIGIIKDSNSMRVIVDGADVTEKIRGEAVGMMASRISAIPLVRAGLLEIQREAGKEGEVIAEGRDMGTVVFPDADIKIFLDADPAERSRRRYHELMERGENVAYEEIKKDIAARDEQDTTRAIAPLKPAGDAIIVDTTALGIDDVVEKIRLIVDQRKNDDPFDIMSGRE